MCVSDAQSHGSILREKLSMLPSTRISNLSVLCIHLKSPERAEGLVHMQTIALSLRTACNVTLITESCSLDAFFLKKATYDPT